MWGSVGAASLGTRAVSGPKLSARNPCDSEGMIPPGVKERAAHGRDKRTSPASPPPLSPHWPTDRYSPSPPAPRAPGPRERHGIRGRYAIAPISPAPRPDHLH